MTGSLGVFCSRVAECIPCRSPNSGLGQTWLMLDCCDDAFGDGHDLGVQRVATCGFGQGITAGAPLLRPSDLPQEEDNRPRTICKFSRLLAARPAEPRRTRAALVV